MTSLTTHSDALRKAAEIAKIHLTLGEAERLVREIEEVLAVFARIDRFQEPAEHAPPQQRATMRPDIVRRSGIDPFSNARWVQNKKFLGPRLVD